MRRTKNSGTTTMTVYAFGLEEHLYSGNGTSQGNTYYYSLAGRLVGELTGTTPKTNIFLTDPLGSVLATFSNTAGTAALLGNQVYGPYGTQRYSSVGTMGTNKGFTGQYNDSLTGLDYYNARYYDPVVGVFLAADTVEGNLQGMNPYAYVGGNPETKNDPTGYCGGLWDLVCNIGAAAQNVVNFVRNTATDVANNCFCHQLGSWVESHLPASVQHAMYALRNAIYPVQGAVYTRLTADEGRGSKLKGGVQVGGAHTIDRHVGKSLTFLATRAQSEAQKSFNRGNSGVASATSFYDEKTAEWTVQYALDHMTPAQRLQYDTAHGGPSLELHGDTCPGGGVTCHFIGEGYSYDYNTGSLTYRGNITKYAVIIRFDSSGAYVLTAYPEF
ncbi:MAG: RHS repeat-associated core domain-containing protein [Ktedonobacteraceae bacterium]